MNAFLFVPLLAATWAIGFAIALFAAHYFLTVLESTAVGSEQVVWPEEPLVDWFWKAFYLAFLGGVWITPMIIIGRSLTPDPVRRVAIVGIGSWLCFPIGMISSQSAKSPWVPFYPAVFARLSQRRAAVFGFYLVSIPIMLGLAASFHFILRSEVSFALSALLAPLAAAAYLIYARALGRLGFVLSFTKGGNNQPSKPRHRKKKAAPLIGEHTEQPINKQPSELPPIETPFEGAISGYDVVFDEGPQPASPTPVSRKVEDADDESPIQLTPQDVDSDDKSDEPQPPLPEPSPAELASPESSKPVKEPKQPYDASLFTFLFESRSASAWFVLSFGLALLGGMIRAMRELKPT